jgi:kynurenine formamidase
MPLDWEWMPDEVFPLATHFLLPPRLHPGKGMTLSNETGTNLMLPGQFREFRRSPRIHEIEPGRLTLRPTAVVTVAAAAGGEIGPADLDQAIDAVDVRPGDALLLRTGWGDDSVRFRGTDRYLLDSPYLAPATAAHLASRMDELGSDLLLTDSGLVGRPQRHLIPQWASLMPRPAPWPSEAARVYLQSYTEDRVREDWAADLELARAGKMVVKRLIGCGAVHEPRVRVIVAPLLLLRAIGATCRVVALPEP